LSSENVQIVLKCGISIIDGRKVGRPEVSCYFTCA
jgi:hypothetical protein